MDTSTRLPGWEGIPVAAAPASTPDCEPHTPSPKGYLAYAEWAGDMMQAGWVQRKCPGCMRWLIWEAPRTENGSAPAAPAGEDET